MLHQLDIEIEIEKWNFNNKVVIVKFRFMNIDINILSVQCLLFNSVILNAEHKDKEEI